MQINSVNSTNFKGSEYGTYLKQLREQEDFEKSLRAAKIVEDMFTKQEETETPKKKNAVQVAATVLGAALVSFLLTRKAYRGGSKAIEGFKNLVAENKSTKKLSDDTFGKIAKTITNSKKFQKLSGTKFAENANAFVKKVGVENVVSGAGAVAGTAYIATSDSNNDGIADIAQKGVNVYKGILEKGGIIADAISVLS